MKHVCRNVPHKDKPYRNISEVFGCRSYRVSLLCFPPRYATARLNYYFEKKEEYLGMTVR